MTKIRQVTHQPGEILVWTDDNRLLLLDNSKQVPRWGELPPLPQNIAQVVQAAGPLGGGIPPDSDPVCYEDDGWYFYDEVHIERYGPFETEQICREKLNEYCDAVLNKPPEPKADI